MLTKIWKEALNGSRFTEELLKALNIRVTVSPYCKTRPRREAYVQGFGTGYEAGYFQALQDVKNVK